MWPYQQDGGVLTNNPSALGLHESKLLWPDTPIQCVVSLGTGRYDPMEEGLESPEYSSLKKKLYQIMISATDTECESKINRYSQIRLSEHI